MSAVIDFHSHVLPGIDDGASTLAESIGMMQMEAEQGIRQVIATPHFYGNHDTPERFLKRRAKAEARLREAMEACENLPRLGVGAEVYYFQGISDCDVLSELTIDQKKCILIEMPMSDWSERMYRELENIQVKQGLIPIIAHVDRYIRPFQTHGIPERLSDLPVLVQANASFFLNRWTAGMALRMLQKEQIHLLGSDCHNLTGRAPNLGDAVQVVQHRLGSGAIGRIRNTQNQILQK